MAEAPVLPPPIPNIPVPLELIDECCDPAIVTSGGGEILWANQAAKRIWDLGSDKIPSLTKLVSIEDADRILATRYMVSFELSPCNSLLSGTSQACTALYLGTGAPEGTRFLIIFQPYTPDSSRLAQHEEFLASVAHDLKNPLGAIFGYADALLDTSLSEGLSDKQREVVHRVRATAFRTLELVRNFQHLAQLQSARITPPAKPCDLNQAIQTVVDSTWRPSSTGATLTVALAKNPILIRVERIQLERVVSNLVNNALKFTPPKGTVTIRSFLGNASKPDLEVHNTGSYIPPEEQELVFQRYQRGSTGKGVPGSGLGLFIVKSILDAVGGAISLRSSVQDGTTFSVHFPK